MDRQQVKSSRVFVEHVEMVALSRLLSFNDDGLFIDEALPLPVVEQRLQSCAYF